MPTNSLLQFSTFAQCLLIVDAIVCGLMALLLLFYSRNGSTFRPNAGRLAYVAIVAAAAVPVLAFFGVSSPPSLASVILHGILAMGVVATRGNVVELFHTSSADNFLYRWLRKDRRQNERSQHPA